MTRRVPDPSKILREISRSSGSRQTQGRSQFSTPHYRSTHYFILINPGMFRMPSSFSILVLVPRLEWCDNIEVSFSLGNLKFRYSTTAIHVRKRQVLAQSVSAQPGTHLVCRVPGAGSWADGPTIIGAYTGDGRRWSIQGLISIVGSECNRDSINQGFNAAEQWFKLD